jgi:simple sugar transport system permease protein
MSVFWHSALRRPKFGRDQQELALLYLACLAFSLLLAMLLIHLSGSSWTRAVNALVDGAFQNPGRWGETLRRTAPLLVVATGSVVATRAGIINIGQEGQLLIGAMGGAFILTLVQPGSPLMLLLGLAVGGTAGAVWAGIAGALWYWRRVPIVLSTLLLVYLSSQIAAYTLTRGELLLNVVPGEPNRLLLSAKVAPESRLGIVHIFGNRFPLSVPVALATALVFGWVLARTTWGFRLKALGLNPRTAQRAGIPGVRYGMSAILVSGATAGLAGSMMLAGGESQYKFSSGFASNVGWDGLLVALVARNSPLLAIPVALVFAALRSGSTFLSVAGIEAVLVDVVRGLLVVALFIPPAISELRRKRRAAAQLTERT